MSRHESFRDKTLKERILILLPLYTAAFVVLLCGVSAVNSTIDDSGLTSTTVILSLAGVASSFAMRVIGVSPGLPAWVMSGLLIVFIVRHNSVADLIFSLLQASRADPTSSASVGIILQWASLAFSFTMVSNQSVLFLIVPCIAMLGLMSSENLNPEMVTYFLNFVLASVFLMGYELHLERSKKLSGEEVGPVVRSLLLVSLVVVTGAGILGGIFSAALGIAGRGIITAATDRLSETSVSLMFPITASSTDVLSLSGLPPSTSGKVVMKVKAQRPSYWKERTFTHYTGSEWHAGMRFYETLDGQQLGGQKVYSFRLDQLMEEIPKKRVRLKQTFHLEEELSGPLRAASFPVEITGRFGEIAVNPLTMDVNVVTSGSVTNYSVVSLVPAATPDDLRKAYGELDGERSEETFPFMSGRMPLVPARVIELTRQIVAGKPTQYDRAVAIQNYLRTNCRYTLNPPTLPPETDATDFFLFRSKAGYCQQFASAMAVMCLLSGIPARVAVGYTPGTWDSTERCFVVRDRDAHAWVEIFFPGYGWIPFDPTAGVRVEGQGIFSLRRLYSELMSLVKSRRLMPNLMLAM
ncbi:MAG: transglutaminase-like domain-containing protein, partial [Armatimonadota bacterium]